MKTHNKVRKDGILRRKSWNTVEQLAKCVRYNKGSLYRVSFPHILLLLG